MGSENTRITLGLAGFWAWALMGTWADHRIGTDADTYGLIAVAIALTIAVVLLRVNIIHQAQKRDCNARN